ncbi:SulP family inorganic anion transporter [Nonomuraea sp. GTA35]|uniref:SulP family inorganic anion transporter n=1 Tax=Nonomuraea sp. GTA35 TaxID=1676746 RepID=UPI0035BF3A19
MGARVRGLPMPSLPWTALADPLSSTMSLLGPALGIALLVYASSVLTARAMAAKEGKDADAQQEFLGLAAANAAAGLLGGFPANGSDSRSALLAGSGARTRLAGPAAGVSIEAVRRRPGRGRRRTSPCGTCPHRQNAPSSV